MKRLALLTMLALAACANVSAPHAPSDSDGATVPTPKPPTGPVKCTNCGIDKNPPGVKIYDPNATY